MKKTIISILFTIFMIGAVNGQTTMKNTYFTYMSIIKKPINIVVVQHIFYYKTFNRVYTKPPTYLKRFKVYPYVINYSNYPILPSDPTFINLKR